MYIILQFPFISFFFRLQLVPVSPYGKAILEVLLHSVFIKKEMEEYQRNKVMRSNL
jgi:hypothetical protein